MLIVIGILDADKIALGGVAMAGNVLLEPLQEAIAPLASRVLPAST